MGERVVGEEYNRADGKKGGNDEFFSDDKDSDRRDASGRSGMNCSVKKKKGLEVH